MLHILLTILSTLGIVLLVILGIIIFLVLCLLFTPVCYSGKVRKQGDSLYAGATVYWLLHLVHVRITYEDRKASWEIRILGIPVLRLREWLKRRKLKKKKKEGFRYEGARKKPTVPPGGAGRAEKAQGKAESQQAEPRQHRQETAGRQESAGAQSRREEPGGEEAGAESGGFLRRGFQVLRTIASLPGKLRAVLKKIFSTIRNICGKIREWYQFLTSHTFQEAFRVIRTEGKVILKHVLPRRISGYVKFGLEDPATTGQVLGVLGMFYPVLPEKLEVIPDFENPGLEADVKARGHVFLIVLLVHGLRIFRNRYVQKVIKKFQHKEA